MDFLFLRLSKTYTKSNRFLLDFTLHFHHTLNRKKKVCGIMDEGKPKPSSYDLTMMRPT